MYNQNYELMLQNAMICADGNQVANLLGHNPNLVISGIFNMSILDFLLMNIRTGNPAESDEYIKMADSIIRASILIGVSDMFNDRDASGQTFMHLAASLANSSPDQRNCLVSIVSGLVASGADPMICNQRNESPRDVNPSFMDDVIKDVSEIKENINPETRSIFNPGEETRNPVAQNLLRYTQRYGNGVNF